MECLIVLALTREKGIWDTQEFWPIVLHKHEGTVNSLGCWEEKKYVYPKIWLELLFSVFSYRISRNTECHCYCFHFISSWASAHWFGQSISVEWNFSLFSIRREPESSSGKMESSCSLLGNKHSPPPSSLIRNQKRSNLLWAKVS